MSRTSSRLTRYLVFDDVATIPADESRISDHMGNEPE
jgi:hypothetical protein